jgi:hypothetical protein
MNSLGAIYLDSAIRRLLTYKTLGDSTFAQLEENDFHWVPRLAPSQHVALTRELANDGPSAETPVASLAPNAESNSIAVIIRHLHGNMLSRWTNFLTEDGEKPDRDRDTEFLPPPLGKEALIALWEEGWNCLLTALRALRDQDLVKTITIRHEPLIVVDAINRQLAHYPHHVGQIVYIGKMIRNEKWQSLSIPRGASGTINRQMKEIHLKDHK